METQPRRAYPTDLNNKQWGRLATLFALPTSGRGRPRTWTYREILNAIFYLVRSGEAWRFLPPDFSPGQTGYWDFWRWRNNGVLDKLHTALGQSVPPQERR